MQIQWYYEHERERLGPFSASQLKAFAVEGRILLTDTVWKEGVAKGVAASDVKNLFPPAPVVHTEASSRLALAALAQGPVNAAVASLNGGIMSETSGAAPAGAEPEPQASAAPPAKPVSPPPRPVRKLRAVAIRGLVIVNQDGAYVYFRKKCVVCGNEDPNKIRQPIKSGMNRVSYHCGKCRRAREAEYQGMF